MSFLRVPNYHVSSLRVNCTNYQIPEKEPITRPRRIVVERTFDLQRRRCMARPSRTMIACSDVVSMAAIVLIKDANYAGSGRGFFRGGISPTFTRLCTRS